MNGEIRNPTRVNQLNRIAITYGIPLQTKPSPLTKEHGWMAGFFDANGTITLNSSTHQLTVSVSQKHPLL